MTQGRGRRRAAATLALTASLTLTGCTGTSGPPGAEPSTHSTSPTGATTTPSSSPTETAPSEPAPSEPAAPEAPEPRRGPVGQQQFADFVMAAWSWSLRTNDPSPLLGVGPSRDQECDGCRALARELAGRSKEGWYVDFAGLTVKRTRLRREATDVVATSRVAIPESDSFLADGTYRSTSPAHDDATFTVTMRWVRGAYRLVSFAVS